MFFTENCSLEDSAFIVIKSVCDCVCVHARASAHGCVRKCLCVKGKNVKA